MHLITIGPLSNTVIHCDSRRLCGMAAARKLLAEIDRTLKKIAEGNDAFDEIWDKVYSAPSASQKEKFEVGRPAPACVAMHPRAPTMLLRCRHRRRT